MVKKKKVLLHITCIIELIASNLALYHIERNNKHPKIQPEVRKDILARSAHIPNCSSRIPNPIFTTVKSDVVSFHAPCQHISASVQSSSQKCTKH